MDKTIIKCPAKINLSLDILGKREDGFHEIETIMQTISLNDVIYIEKSEDFSIKETGKTIQLVGENIALRAAKLMFSEYDLSGGVEIKLEKNIPVAAGLAGGSSDAAGVIRGINKLYDLKLSVDEMKNLASKLGSDISYLIEGGTALCTGRGEKTSHIKTLKDINVLIVKPNIAVSTKEVYEGLDLKNMGKRPKTEDLIGFIEGDNVDKIYSSTGNVLESVTIKKYPIISEIKKQMINSGAAFSMMSGSGPSVFGIFNSNEEIKKAYETFKDLYEEVYITKTI